MTAVEDRRLRADAARNVERILRAARAVYSELGPDAPVEAVARRAGVGERTLYRRFPAKADLVRAALDQSIAEDLTPVIDSARLAKDPLRGLTQLIEAAISLGAREHSLLTAARRAGSLTSDISVSLNGALGELARAGQRAGSIRADLVTDDLPRLVAMLFSVLSTMDAASDGWRRYVALVIDAISVSDRRPLLRPPRCVTRCSPTAGPCDRVAAQLARQARFDRGLLLTGEIEHDIGRRGIADDTVGLQVDHGPALDEHHLGDLHRVRRVGSLADHHEPVGADVDGLLLSIDLFADDVAHVRRCLGGRGGVGKHRDRIDHGALAVGILENLSHAGDAAGILARRPVGGGIRADVTGLDQQVAVVRRRSRGRRAPAGRGGRRGSRRRGRTR